jgi:hypothetical protein
LRDVGGAGAGGERSARGAAVNRRRLKARHLRPPAVNRRRLKARHLNAAEAP